MDNKPPELDTREAIVVHLEGLTIANNQKLRNREFSSIDGMTFGKPLLKFADEAPGQGFTLVEVLYMGKMLCQAHPEYDPKIIHMVATLGNGDAPDEVKKITKAQTFMTYERNGIPPGMVTNGVMILATCARMAFRR